MRELKWLLVLAVFAVPFHATANDLCVIWRCSASNGQSADVQAFDQGTALSAAREYYKLTTGLGAITCSCQKNVHFAQASEISSAISTDIKTAIIEATRLATAEAMTKIQQDNARREEEMYKRLAEVVQKTDAQIKLLTELVRTSTGAQGGDAGPKPTQGSAPPQPSSTK